MGLSPDAYMLLCVVAQESTSSTYNCHYLRVNYFRVNFEDVFHESLIIMLLLKYYTQVNTQNMKIERNGK